MNNLSKIIHLSPPNLAYFAPWRESIPLFEYFNSNGKFAQAAQILKDSSTEFAEVISYLLLSRPWRHSTVRLCSRP